MSGHVKHPIYRNLLLCSLLILLAACSSVDEEKGEDGLSNEEINALSATMGHFIYENLHSQQININMDSLIQGMRDAQGGGTPPLSKQEFMESLTKYKENLQMIKGAENLKIAEDFLEENKLEPHVVSLEGGKVQYRVLEEGNGPTVQEGSAPLINYEGRLIDGTVFDSTTRRGEPAKLPLDATISGFKKGVLGMKEGEKRRLIIHPAMGYSMQGRLPPNSLLIFDIEVVKADSQPDALSQNEEPEETPEEPEEEIQGENSEMRQKTSYHWLQKVRDAVF